MKTKTPLFPCGHVRAPWNTVGKKQFICRSCRQARDRRARYPHLNRKTLADQIHTRLRKENL